MKLAEVLTGPDVWCKGTVFNGHRMCLIGGVHKLLALDDPPEYAKRQWILLPRSEWVRLMRAIKEVDPDVLDTVGIGAWQDKRTWDDMVPVIDAYDRDRMLNP